MLLLPGAGGAGSHQSGKGGADPDPGRGKALPGGMPVLRHGLRVFSGGRGESSEKDLIFQKKVGEIPEKPFGKYREKM